MKQKEYKKVVYLFAFIAALGGFVFGLDQGFIAFALDKVDDVYSLAMHQGEDYAAILATGGILGTLCAGLSNKYIGRRNSIVLAGFVFTTMSLVSAFLPSFEVLKLARFFIGFAVGVASLSVPLYLAEISPRNIRGGVGTMFQLMLTVGIFVVAVANYIIAQAIENPRVSLSVMFVFLLVFSFLMFALCLLLPKSPRWLLSRGEQEKARSVLSRLWNTEADINKEIDEFNSIHSNTHKSSILKSLTDKYFLKTLAIGVLLLMFRQLVGINFIIFYSPTILGYVGLAGAFASLALYFINMVFTLPAIKLTDKWGRKKLLYVGSVLMLITMLTAALSYYMLDNKLKGATGGEVTFYQYLLVVSFAVYLMAFAATWGPIARIICAEIFPIQSREVGMTVTSMVNWTFVGVVASFSLPVMRHFGNFAAPLMFAGFCLLSIFLTVLFVPETKGISLEKIEKNLVSGRRLRELGQE